MQTNPQRIAGVVGRSAFLGSINSQQPEPLPRLNPEAEIAEKSLQFVETVCTHQKAEWAGQPFLLSPNQQFILWNLTGWRRENGCRRFRRAYITAGRNWGNSLFASVIMKLLTLYDTPLESGAEVYSIATAEDQARLVYDASTQSNHH